ncbi:unnamed protein product [Clavelina lepadiformis]|uniref:Uncharacterized protein n=1 Tax=Clavelina lepadiformis TaxID=159417 RepID=A0ABP0GLA0_CLALP
MEEYIPSHVPTGSCCHAKISTPTSKRKGERDAPTLGVVSYLLLETYKQRPKQVMSGEPILSLTCTFF